MIKAAVMRVLRSVALPPEQLRPWDVRRRSG